MWDVPASASWVRGIWGGMRLVECLQTQWSCPGRWWGCPLPVHCRWQTRSSGQGGYVSTNGNGGDICPACVANQSAQRSDTNRFVGQHRRQGLVRSDSEISPGCPSLEEGEEGLGLLVALTHYRRVSRELGPIFSLSPLTLLSPPPHIPNISSSPPNCEECHPLPCFPLRNYRLLSYDSMVCSFLIYFHCQCAWILSMPVTI